jgi:hypothetical protein
MTGSLETAAQLDTAIDDLIQGPTGPRPVSEGELSSTARLLRDTLPRFHPRFSFEEHLAERLSVLRDSRLAQSPEEPISIEHASNIRSEADSADEATDRWRRGLVAGGAIASGVSLAIPIAGAALVVWRRSRSSGGLL